ncbi:MAG TPA: 1-acyl-sn-glycerol-3-phosphate acyltransferase [Lactobacillus sp.]|nr:1-acyl-sn-glycerol-3-phosphate acyltransferase [Lactobacillus sp.]
MSQRIQYFHAFDEDVLTTGKPVSPLSSDYRWQRTQWWERLWSLIFRFSCKLFAYLYCHLVWHLKIVNGNKLKDAKQQGYFLYANHTQPVNDVFMPLIVGGARRFHAIVSPDNFNVPVIGHQLPYGGALPTAASTKQTIQLIKAIDRIMKANEYVVIYPEAHVWPYYTGIRPFPETSFSFPVNTGKPAFCMTTTYQHRRFGQRPRLTVYIDGPFYPATDQSKKVQRHQLWEQTQATLKQRSQSSTYEYVKYEKR